MSEVLKECPGCLCPVESVAKGGRTFVSYENVYPVPDWLEIPTCTACGARYESKELSVELDYLARMFDRDLLDKMIEYGNRMEMALILREVVLRDLDKLFSLKRSCPHLPWDFEVTVGEPCKLCELGALKRVVAASAGGTQHVIPIEVKTDDE